MTFMLILKLILKPSQWESTHGMYDDELQTKDKKIRFFSNEAVRFRDEKRINTVYDVNIFAWILILPLSQILRIIVKNREARK